MVVLPYHAAEQRNKKQNNGSNECPAGVRHFETSAFYEQHREAEGQVIGCLFWFVFGQAKMNNNKMLIYKTSDFTSSLKF